MAIAADVFGRSEKKTAGNYQLIISNILFGSSLIDYVINGGNSGDRKTHSHTSNIRLNDGL